MVISVVPRDSGFLIHRLGSSFSLSRWLQAFSSEFQGAGLSKGKKARQGTGTSYILRMFSGGFVKPILPVSHWQELGHVASPRCKGRLRDYSGQSCARVKIRDSSAKVGRGWG